MVIKLALDNYSINSGIKKGKAVDKKVGFYFK